MIVGTMSVTPCNNRHSFISQRCAFSGRKLQNFYPNSFVANCTDSFSNTSDGEPVVQGNFKAKCRYDPSIVNSFLC